MEGQGGQPRPLQMGAKGAYIVRLLMVGDSSCGKTSLVLRFDQNVFSTKFVTTIGVDYRDKMVKVRQVVLFTIHETMFAHTSRTLISCELNERSKGPLCDCSYGTRRGKNDSDL